MFFLTKKRYERDLDYARNYQNEDIRRLRDDLRDLKWEVEALHAHLKLRKVQVPGRLEFRATS